MRVKRKQISTRGIKLFIEKDGLKIARAYLYIMKNDLHKKPFGLLEDVFVDENERGQGMGTKLIKEAVKEAKQNKCYKLIATSRHSRAKVHALYKKLGFKNYGIELRMNLEEMNKK